MVSGGVKNKRKKYISKRDHVLKPYTAIIPLPPLFHFIYIIYTTLPGTKDSGISAGNPLNHGSLSFFFSLLLSLLSTYIIHNVYNIYIPFENRLTIYI